MTKKTCYTCKKEKPIQEFSINQAKKDGYNYECKNCANKRQESDGLKVWRKKYRQTRKYTIYRKKYCKSKANMICQKRYRHSKKGRKFTKRYYPKWRLKHLAQRKAQTAITNAIGQGKIPRASTFKCICCPKQAQQYHHHLGYEPEHWLDVIPVCHKCHRKLHKSVLPH